jgi:hypothetical protein
MKTTSALYIGFFYITFSLSFGFNIQAHGADVVRLKLGREIFAAYANITGVDANDLELKTLFKLNETRLPKYGTPEELSNNVILGATELGGAFCKKSITREILLPFGQRTLFKLVNFKRGQSQFSPFLRDQIMDHLAVSFWQRDMTAAEKLKVATTMSRITAGAEDNADATVNYLQILCSTYATSLAFLVK